MSQTKLKIASALLLFFGSLGGGPTLAATVGDKLPALVLEDQHGTEHTLDARVRRIYTNADRDADKLMEAAMDGLDQATLNQQAAVVIANISAAPGFVKRIIKSGLKDRPYLTWVDTRNKTRGVLPTRADTVTLLDIDNLQISSIRYINDAQALRAALQQHDAAPDAEKPPTEAAAPAPKSATSSTE